MATALDRGAYGYRSSKRSGRPIGWDRNEMARYAGSTNAEGREISTSGGLKSLPGAPMSPREAMSTSGLGTTMGMTDDAAWDRFFTRRLPGEGSRMDAFRDDKAGLANSARLAQSAQMATSFNTFLPQTGADAASEMASAFQSFDPKARRQDGFNRSFIPSPASPTPTNPRQLIAEAMDSSLQFFDRAGIPMDGPAPGRVQSGTQFASPYGTGSVRYAGDDAAIYAPGTGNIRPRRTAGQSFDLSFLAI